MESFLNANLPNPGTKDKVVIEILKSQLPIQVSMKIQSIDT